ncbi:retrovirus-related pol polyprotein from transposon TNT 1-94 [Tanacetum coccineum]
MTSITRTPQQNAVVERRNHTLEEAARTMLIFSKSLLVLWGEAIATVCYTQNRSLIHTHYNKTPYELLRDRKPKLKYLHVFGALCYPINKFEDLGKLQPQANIGIFIGPDLQGLTFGHISSGLVLNQAASTSAKPPTKNDKDLLFQTMFDEYFKNPSDASNPISAATLPPPDTVGLSSSSSFTSIDKDTFTNPFAPTDTISAESSSRIFDTSNMHTFQQPPIYTKRWPKDHP